MACQRVNNSTGAYIDQGAIFAQGTFKIVWRGTYTRGERTGQACVAKEFKTGSAHEAHYFDEEMKIIAGTQRIIDAWHAAKVIDLKILLNIPEVWREINGRAPNISRRWALIEPFIENFEKFNSNSGWARANSATDSHAWNEVMQALSHFSYHNFRGQLLLCDLQGGAYRDGFILSDPIIMSQERNWGPGDLGPEGIRSFFQRHRCGAFCSRQWTVPPFVYSFPTIPMRMGTTMTEVPTCQSRMPLSKIAE